jgi:hypothetical protein
MIPPSTNNINTNRIGFDNS